MSSTSELQTESASAADNAKPRALVAKCGLDAHERGVHVVSRGLRDNGFEVVYLGLRNTPEAICNVAQQEDVDVIGISSLAGGHRNFLTRLGALMRERGMDDVLLVAGGVIPDEDHEYLREQGVAGVFTQGTPVSDIVKFIRANLRS
jgi:methylmalonyl-CoA mutase, C-terminal domain